MPCSARTWNRPFSVSPARSALRPPSFGKSPIAWFTLLQSVPNILPPEPIINKESSIGIGSTSLPSLRNDAALSRSFLGQIRFQNRPRALPRRRGNVVTGAWQRTVRYIVMKTKDGETKTRDGETTRREHVAANGLRGRSAKRMAEELTGATARLHGPYASINHVAAS